MEIANKLGDYSYYERLTNYTKTSLQINGHEFLFVVEETRNNSLHACSVKDVATMIGFIPKEDYGELKAIVFRQPKRKEDMLNPVWGSLYYSYRFEGDFFPAIVLNAVDLTKKLKWSNKLDVDDAEELERLKSDGHLFKTDKRWHIAELKEEFARNTQLYRSLIHEFGHYVHYLEKVERPGNEKVEYETFEQRWEQYFKIPKPEKEKFAHNYADRLSQTLRDNGQIPFTRK